MGDPAGIGGELSLRAWLALHRAGHCFVALDAPDRLTALARALTLDVPVATVASPDEADAVFATSLPVSVLLLIVNPIV